MSASGSFLPKRCFPLKDFKALIKIYKAAHDLHQKRKAIQRSPQKPPQGLVLLPGYWLAELLAELPLSSSHWLSFQAEGLCCSL